MHDCFSEDIAQLVILDYTFSSLTDKPQVGLNIEFFSYFVLAVSKQQGFFILLTQEWSQREIYQDF